MVKAGVIVMSNTVLLLTLLAAYLLFLAGTAWRLSYNSKTNKTNTNSHYLFGSGFGFLLSFFGIAASLFSTFTLEGMPAFFKNHGIASWVFLGITDVCLAALLLYFGLKMRHFARQLAINNNKRRTAKNLTEWLKQSGLPKWVVIFFVASVTVFMIPYITIQIKGTAVMLQTAIPLGETHLLWSIMMVALMMTYSWFGGIKAIFVTDMVQGLVLLVTVWAIAFFAISASGGMGNLFAQVATIEPALLSAPGPKGVLNWQFLLIGFISIVLMPYVQPQLFTRVLVAKSDKAFARSTMALAVFAILVILPTLFIGLRSVLVAQNMPEGHFLLNLISSDAPMFFYALFIVGVLAAAMSTADSQLMAIGTEWSSAMTEQDIQKHPSAKVLVKSIGAVVALVALALAQTSFKSLILFSINSFIGTSLLLPIVLATAVRSQAHRWLLIISSVVAVAIFLPVVLGILPKMIMGLRIELILYAVQGCLLAWVWLSKKSSGETSYVV